MTQFYTQNQGQWYAVDTDAGTRIPVAEPPADSEWVGGVAHSPSSAFLDHFYPVQVAEDVRQTAYAEANAPSPIVEAADVTGPTHSTPLAGWTPPKIDVGPIQWQPPSVVLPGINPDRIDSDGRAVTPADDYIGGVIGDFGSGVGDAVVGIATGVNWTPIILGGLALLLLSRRF